MGIPKSVAGTSPSIWHADIGSIDRLAMATEVDAASVPAESPTDDTDAKDALLGVSTTTTAKAS